MNNIAYLSMGSNLGNRLEYLHNAVRILDQDENIEIVRLSSIYETEPVGFTNQGNFLNLVMKIKTSYSAQELLEKCLNTEKIIGRKRGIRWGPRTIDLDILLYNQDNIETDSLSVPHPRIQERAFVIIPLLEIEPNITIPKMKDPLYTILNGIPDKEGVRLWKRKNGEDAFELFGN